MWQEQRHFLHNYDRRPVFFLDPSPHHEFVVPVQSHNAWTSRSIHLMVCPILPIDLVDSLADRYCTLMRLCMSGLKPLAFTVNYARMLAKSFRSTIKTFSEDFKILCLLLQPLSIILPKQRNVKTSRVYT